MNLPIFDALNSVLLFSFLLDARFPELEKRFSFDLVRILAVIPLLAAEYIYLGAYMEEEIIVSIYFSETVFALIWIMTAWNMRRYITPSLSPSRMFTFTPILAMALGMAGGIFWQGARPLVMITGEKLIIPYHGGLFFASLLVLMVVLFHGWCTESFWRALNRPDRQKYKYLLIAFFVISGSLAWSTSVRLTYLRQSVEHLLLLAILLIIAWCLLAYAIAAGRLLNREIFVSRKVVYSSVAPLIFGVYLLAVGVASLLMRVFGWPLNFILHWLIIISGLLLLAALTLSSSVRNRVKYFISTHFYVNKYEYRDEWLAFSELLSRPLSEKGIVNALQQVLRQSLYTYAIHIWTGDVSAGFRRVETEEDDAAAAKAAFIPAESPLVAWLQKEPFLNCQPAPEMDTEHLQLVQKEQPFLAALDLALLVPMIIGDHLVGIIGLGPEYTGGRYGQDDFDLLAALGSQAASALLAARMAEELARAREQSAWNILAAFVLHDIKNAATMLALVRENAPRHIAKPEFQQDMLTSIDDALKRMEKVQTRLKTLQGEIEPAVKSINAFQLIERCTNRISGQLTHLALDIRCPRDLILQTDPDFFCVILENLILNAREAGDGYDIRVTIRLEPTPDHGFRLDLADNGPGIPVELLPERLFDPFVTSRPQGSGIGLWQVSRLVKSLGGTISVQNREEGGARFIVDFPREVASFCGDPGNK